MVCICLSKYRRSGHFHSKNFFRGLHKPRKKTNTKYVLQRIIITVSTFLYTRFHSTAIVVSSLIPTGDLWQMHENFLSV